jgi:hypothetical protein
MRCPVCRAENNVEPQCRRCRADLSLLFAVAAGRSRLRQEAARRAAAGAWGEAARLAGQAHGLRHGEDSRRLLAVAHLMQRDFAGAWQIYQESQHLLSEPGA